MLVHVRRPVDVSLTHWDTRWFAREDAIEEIDYDHDRLTEVLDSGCARRPNRENVDLDRGIHLDRGIPHVDVT